MFKKDNNQKEAKINKSNNSKKSFFKRIKSNKHNFFIKFKESWPLSKTSGKIFLIYLCVVLIGGFLLSIPGFALTSQADSKYNWDYLTGLFTASSGFSDTGLTVIDVSHSYTFWGQFILLILIEFGGIGVLTFKIVLFLLINKKISISDTMVAQSERGSTITSSTIQLIKDGFIWLTIVQIFSAFILFFLFFFNEPAMSNNGVSLETVSPFHDFWRSLWFAVFHSTSAVNNAGFDIISPNSLQPYNTIDHKVYSIQIIFMLEWIIGGLGYPTFHDIKRKIQARKTGQKVKFSLFTKLSFWVYLTLFIFGPLLVLSTEYSNYDNSLIFNNLDSNLNKTIKPFNEVFMDVLFNTTASRNAGFSTINMSNFNSSSKFILSVLMFIGSAPSSTAGGIRTTTFAILLLSTLSIIKNRNYTSAFKKTIPEATVRRSHATFFISTFLIFISVFTIYIDSNKVFLGTNDKGTISEILLLICSAFGTVGLSPLTHHDMYKLGAVTKILIILVMFIGQLGVSNTLLVFLKPARQKALKFLDEDVTIG
ncbi:TrkH family potassium uptake protein [Mycoplasma yeatsii]|uniref:Trk system potassium uptake protein TrkH n=1 Tax=Mycoplasma yeatsii TaxID=51365 RepID=A0ABU0NFJ0_9MOLU|nr:potassium transporter TrkG [Mycoplasma yeatsii]MDQ0567932.1 trk system potassium uptake protein TrkH [Mycoplasma yeatsii]